MNKEDNLSCLLQDWQVPDTVIAKFRENEIHKDQLKDLRTNDEFLKELCPLIGHRILLKTKIEEYFTKQTDTATTATNSLTEHDFEDTLALDDITLENLLTPVRPSLPEFDLKTLLSTSPHGKSIIEYYSTHNTLTNKHRNLLVDIIVRHIFTRIVNYKITHEEYNLLTGKIVVLFPKESSGTYFVPPVRKSLSYTGKPLFARGKLVDKIRNTLHKSGEKRKSKTVKDQQEDKRSKLIEELKDKQEDSIAFLKNNTEPWTEIIEHWKSTYPLRAESHQKSVSEYIQEWNILNDPRGDVLINLDFEEKYKENSMNFYTKWHTFINTVISLKFDSSKDDMLADLYDSITQQTDDDKKIPEQIKLLCHIIPPKGRLNKHTKFSTLECIENFIVDVDNFGDIENKIRDLETKSRFQKQTLQPFLIRCPIVAEQTDKAYYYLVIDKVKYRFESATKAFDTLFKSYHALHANYPKAAEHLYLVIQRCVYGFETKYDKVVPYISDILTLAKM